MRLTPVLPPLILHFYSIENNLLESEKAAIKELILGGDAIAQWILSPKHIYRQICATFVFAMGEKNENKTKRGQVWPIFLKRTNFKMFQLTEGNGGATSEKRFCRLT